MHSPKSRPLAGIATWFGNIFRAVRTVIDAMKVTAGCWLRTYNPNRRTFTEQYEYPELPVRVAPRYRGFHRFDLTACIACERCARDCPVDCIYIDKQRVEGKKGFQLNAFVIDYTKCMFCAYCTESCPVDCIFMGSNHDLSCYSRDGCVVDFARLPVEVAWGRDTLNPTVVALSKSITRPVHGGPNQ
jgi:NADH-quinone oxidoreductase subunit I